MPANAALGSGELTSLNLGYHVCPARLSYVPDTVIGTATVATTPSTSPVVEISVSSPSAGWTSGRVGQTVKITSSGGTLRGYYRLRHSAPTNSLIKIGAATNADVGLLTMGIRTEGIQAGDTVTILERRDLWSVAPRWDVGGTVYQDYDKAVSTLNTSPLPTCNMAINGRAGDYATEVANGASKAMTATVAVTDNIGALTYSWTVPSAWTGVAGTNTATVTGDAPAGAYWLYCTITDATAGAQEIARFVRIHTPNDPPVECNVTRDTRDRSYRSMTVRLPQGRVSVIPAKARCVVWGDMTWGGSDVASANRSFTGYITTQPFNHIPTYHESTVEIVGTCGVLDLLKGYPAEFKYASSPATWEELGSTRTNLQFIMRWMCRYRTANVMETFNFTPFSTSTSIARFKTYSVDPGSLYSQLKQIADSYDANVGSRSDGEILSARHPSMLEDRTGVVTRATISNSIYKSIDIQWERHPKCGHVRLDGRFTDLSADVKLASEAPGKNQYGQGAAQRQMQSKIFESQSDANKRVGRQYAAENNEYPRITVDIPTNWDVFEPVDMQYVPVTVPASKSPTGSALTISTVPLSVTKNWLGGRLASIQLTTEGETNGVEGETGDVPSEGSVTIGDYGNYDLPDYSSPGWGDETETDPIAANGSGLLFTNDGRVAKYNGSIFENKSPSDGQRTSIGTGIKMIANPWSYEGLILYGNQGALVDGNHTAETLSWQPKGLSGANESGGTWSHTFDFAVSDGGWDALVDEDFSPTTLAAHTSSVGWTQATVSGVSFPANRWAYVWITKALPSSTITGIDVHFQRTAVGNSLSDEGGASIPRMFIEVNGSVIDIQNGIGESGIITWSGSQSGVTSVGAGFTVGYRNDSVDVTSTGKITRIVVRGAGTSPFGGGGAVSQDEEFITDIQGSINHEGYFCWLSKRTVSSVDYVYFNYTSDFFNTRKSTQLARYVDGMGYSINLGSYGSPGALVVLASAGDPGTTDTGIYKSLNSGSLFSKITGTDLLYGGGAVACPYMVGGTANASTSPTFGYIRGHNGGTVQFRSYSGATVNIAAGSVPINGYVINGHTLDGNILAVPFTNQIVHRSEDGGDTWGIAGTVPGSGLLGMTGWPNNPGFYAAYGSDCLAKSNNAGTTWTDLRTTYETFASSTWGASEGLTVVSFFGDLSAFMTDEVTQ